MNDTIFLTTCRTMTFSVCCKSMSSKDLKDILDKFDVEIEDCSEDSEKLVCEAKLSDYERLYDYLLENYKVACINFH